MLCHAVTLTFHLLNLNVCSTSGARDKNLYAYQIQAKSNNPQLSHWTFSKFVPSVLAFFQYRPTLTQRGAKRTTSNLGTT